MLWQISYLHPLQTQSQSLLYILLYKSKVSLFHLFSFLHTLAIDFTYSQGSLVSKTHYFWIFLIDFIYPNKLICYLNKFFRFFFLLQNSLNSIISLIQIFPNQGIHILRIYINKINHNSIKIYPLLLVIHIDIFFAK